MTGRWEYSFSSILKKLDRWVEAGFNFLPNFLVALIVLYMFYYAGKILKEIYIKVLNKFSDNSVVNRLVGTGLYVLSAGIGVAAALSVLKLDKAVYSLLAGAGVIGLALGFAFQEIASNFIAGVLIAFTKPYKIGDIVEVKGHVGEVHAIDLRTTAIETYQGLDVIVPNKEMFTQLMINYSATPKRRIDLNIGVSYSSDLELVEKITREALEDVSGRINSKPIDIFYREFGDSSINLLAHVWVRYPGNRAFYQSIHECIMCVKKSYDEHGVTIPFPIRTIDLGLSHQILKDMTS